VILTVFIQVNIFFSAGYIEMKVHRHVAFALIKTDKLDEEPAEKSECRGPRGLGGTKRSPTFIKNKTPCNLK
jgi:hypothetical protein